LNGTNLDYLLNKGLGVPSESFSLWCSK